MQFDLRELAPGVCLHVAREAKWKTTLVLARIAVSLAEDPTRAALVPHVLVRGTERLPTARDLARRLEEMFDAELEPDVLRLGDVQALEWRLDVVHPRFAGGADTLADGLALLGDVLFRPARGPRGMLRRDVVDSEKKNLRAAILGLKDERGEYVVERTARLLGRGTPSERYELGAVEDLPGIGAQDLTERWEALVERHPLDIIVVGDHDPAAVEAAARAGLPLERRRGAPVALPPIAVDRAPGNLRTDESVREVERARVQQAHVCIGWRTGAPYLGEGYAAALALHFVLGADAQSRLFLGVRERDGLAYEAGTIFDRLKGTIAAHCGCDPKNVERVEELVLAEVARLREDLVPGKELDEARRAAIERLREIADDPLLAATFEHARTLAGKRHVTAADVERAIAAVTSEDVREAARRLAPDCVYVLAP